MYGVELYAAVRLAVVEEGLSHREAGRRFGIDRRTVKKMLRYSPPPGYRRSKPVRRPKLEGFTGIIDAILEADRAPDVRVSSGTRRIGSSSVFGTSTGSRAATPSSRTTSGRSGGLCAKPSFRCTIRRAMPRSTSARRQWRSGAFREKIALFCLILPHSDVWFVKAYPKETTEAFLDGHVSAFAFLGGVPQSILYDNTAVAVARILSDGTRQRTRAFTHLQSHYLFRDRFGRPGKGNDKGKVEALVVVKHALLPPAIQPDC